MARRPPQPCRSPTAQCRRPRTPPESSHYNLQHNAAFALYGLSDNEDNLLEFVREGAVQRINECELVVQASKDCVNKLMKRLQVRDAPRRGPLGAVQGRGVG